MVLKIFFKSAHFTCTCTIQILIDEKHFSKAYFILVIKTKTIIMTILVCQLKTTVEVVITTKQSDAVPSSRDGAG